MDFKEFMEKHKEEHPLFFLDSLLYMTEMRVRREMEACSPSPSLTPQDRNALLEQSHKYAEMANGLREFVTDCINLVNAKPYERSASRGYLMDWADAYGEDIWTDQHVNQIFKYFWCIPKPP